MGFLSRLSTTVVPPPMRGLTAQEYSNAFWSGDPVPSLFPGLIPDSVSPELALTLTYVYCAVSTITDDFGTATCQMFEDTGNDGRARVKYSAPGIGTLARMLRWQPNRWQTAKAFWSTMGWQYLLRPAAYAEIIYTPGTGSFVDQLVPRHPDRVRQEVLPSGEPRYRIYEPSGGYRVLTQDEMFVVRNTSTDGLNALSRIDYGSQAILSGLGLQDFTRNYFKKGATAALLATYAGDKEDEDEEALHASITRYMGGGNAGGVLLVPDDIKVSSLGVDPEKSELLGLKNLSGRDVARLFKMPPSWLGIEGQGGGYNSQVQDATNYVNRCQVPMAVEFEQAVQRDLILAVDRFFVKFNLDYLLRADLLARAQAYEILIRSRVIRPSEARVREDLSPDPQLDKLSEGDFRPGSSTTPAAPPRSSDARGRLRATLGMYDDAVRCVRRERAAVEKLAKRFAHDVQAWQDGLKEFYAEHAGFVARTMRISVETARMYSAQHGAIFETKGVVPIAGDNGEHWEREESEELCVLALEGDLARAA